jgi:hypothetical protein
MGNPLAWLWSGSASSLRATSIKLVFSMACCIMVLPALGGTALAYNRGNAVSYADRWALSRNSNYPNYPNSDCTNFASQALHAGGYSFVGTPQPWNSGDDTQWWGDWFLGYWFHTNSWPNAPDHYQFQMAHYPGGWLEEVVTPSNNDYWAHYDNVYMTGGDELFFDWGKGDGMSHVAFQVYSGWSQYTSNWYGDLSDQHVTDRYHVSWNHLEVNGDWPTTTIWEVHIDDNNN